MDYLMSKSLILLIPICLLGFYASHAKNGGYFCEEDSIQIGNIYKTHEAYIPQDFTEQHDLISVLHGSAMTISQMFNVTGDINLQQLILDFFDSL